MMTAKSNDVHTSQRPANSRLRLFSFLPPNIVLVGKADIEKSLLQRQKFYNLEIKYVQNGTLDESIDKRTIAILVDEAIIDGDIHRSIKRLLKKFSLIPVYIVSRASHSDDVYCKLYQYGIKGVVKFPDRDENLIKTLIDTLKPKSNASGSTGADKNLSKTLWAHLVQEGAYENTSINSENGQIELSGTVQTKFDKKALKKICQTIPGVKQVSIEGVSIGSPKKVTDREIKKQIKRHMRSVMGKEARDLSVAVKHKIVTLTGKSNSSKMVNRIIDFALTRRGVDRVRSEVHIAPKTEEKTLKKARAIENRIAALFEGVKSISLKVLGNHAEVQGRVSSQQTRKLIEDYVNRNLPVDRIINKMRIAEA